MIMQVLTRNLIFLTGASFLGLTMLKFGDLTNENGKILRYKIHSVAIWLSYDSVY